MRAGTPMEANASMKLPVTLQVEGATVIVPAALAE
jgi:hypothetical protein